MANHPLEGLLAFSLRNHLIERQDLPFCRNLLLDVLGLDAPQEPYRPYEAEPVELPPTATPYLAALTEDAVGRGVCADTQGQRDAFSARLMGCVTPRPSEVCREFNHRCNAEGAKNATDWFYKLCRDVNYIRVDDIARNIQYKAPTMVGELDITINLSKPEKDPRDIAAARLQKSAGYPPCMLCVENPGDAGRGAAFPARQNHRFVDVELCGEPWHLQYSPYLYYNEHCIVFNEKHQPMHIDRSAFEKLFDFVAQFPHYFIGSNADLPIVGGSILSHDHFQGGSYVFPMTVAPIDVPLHSPDAAVSAGILNWPMSTLRLRGAEPKKLIDVAEKVLAAWRQWSDPACDILAYTDAPHNTITPILRRDGEDYVFDLVLRNNRTTAEHPMGIFHPHADLHHIKMENIGLIEVMGLFILPGRLKAELAALEELLSGKGEVHIDPDTPLYKHLSWVTALRSKYDITPENAHDVLRQGVADKCARVLMDAGVYKQTDAGRKGFLRFLASVGFART